MNVKKIPKIELHVHLDGSVKEKMVYKRLHKKPNMVASNSMDLNEYLTKFSQPISVMQTQNNLKLVSKQLARDLLRDNCIYAEIRFCPLLHTSSLNIEQVIDSVLLGLSEVNIKTNLILCMMRNFNLEDNKRIVDTAVKYLNKGVCAVDLAGAESIYPTNSFNALFDYVKFKNIPYTIHAGEASGIDSIKSAIEFGTTRIGHGIRCIEDNDTISLIKEKNITLEVCPTSNIDTNVCKYIDHPIKKLYDLGVRVTINTDNRTVSNITLNKEYKKLAKVFKFNKKDFIKMNINAIEASFYSDKESLLKEYTSL